MQSLNQYLLHIGVSICPLQTQARTLPYMMQRVASLGHLNLERSHLELENLPVASLIQMSCACLAEQLAMELPVAGVVMAD